MIEDVEDLGAELSKFSDLLVWKTFEHRKIKIVRARPAQMIPSRIAELA
jgi:hypothetical protein